MQTAFKPSNAIAPARRCNISRPAARAHTVKCHASITDNIAKNALMAAAALALTIAPASDAAAAVPKKLTSFQRELKYQEEMRAAVKARSGKDLPDLTSSPDPKQEAVKARPPLKFSEKVEQVTIETSAAVPAPAPAPAAPAAEVPKPAPAPVVAAPAPAPVVATPAPVAAAPAPVVAAPKPVAAPAPAPAAVAAPSAAAPAVDSKALLAIGGIIGVAVVAAAASGGSQEGAAASAAPAAAATGASDVPPNVAEARAWIGAWKKKHGKA